MCHPLRLQSGPWPLACREAMQFQFMDELWGDGQPAPAAEATHPDPAAGTIVIAAAGIDGRAAQQQRREQWGHWRSLSAAQRELRGARLREGKARKRATRLANGVDVHLKDFMHHVVVKSNV